MTGRWAGPTARAAAMVALATAIALIGAQIGSQGGWVPLDRSVETDSGVVFSDVATDVGLDVTHGAFRWGLSPDPVAMMGGGLCWLDFDGDGWLDLFVVDTYAEAEWANWQDVGGVPTSRLFRNDGGTFEDVTAPTNAGLALRGLGCVAGDVDADGDADLYVTSATANALLLNDGSGRFENVASVAGVDAYGWQSSATLGDLDGDGLIDLFVAGYVNLIRPVESSTEGFPRTYEALPDLVFRNLGVGDDGVPRFERVEAGTEPSGMTYGLGSVMTDVDTDGDLDLYVANDTDPNQLYLNESVPGEIKLREIGVAAGVADEHSGMGVAATDLDGTGTVDLAVTNLDYQLHGVFVNAGDSGFASVGDASGFSAIEGEYTGWGVAGADFDLDMDVDVLVVNGNVPVMYPEADRQPLQLFENAMSTTGALTFRAAPVAAGLVGIGPIIGRGAAVADFDNDGDPDVAVTQVGGPLLLLRNDRAGGATLTIAFDRFLPGTRAVVTLSDGSRLVREVHAGSSYLSSEDPRLLFGLGDATAVARVDLTMPGGEVVAFDDLPVNIVMTIP